jgi:hypothetical protein
VHGHVGQVAQHHAAVVGRHIVRVGGGEFVRAPDHRQPEGLRGLAAPQPLARRDLAHHPVGDDHDRVRGGHRGADGIVPAAQRGHARRDDPLVHQRTGRVVEQHPAFRVRRSERGQRCPGRIRPGRPARQHRADLFVRGELSLDLVDVSRRHHHQDLVDVRRGAERGHAVLKQRLTGKLEQLLGQRGTEPLTSSAAQYHRHHPHVPDFTG